MSLSMTLTAAQKSAAEHPAKYLQIIAGPGTGKTLTLASRIANYVRKGAQPSKIVALTFTNDACTALRNTLNQLLDPDIAASINVHTYHSFCSRLIVENPQVADLQPDWRIADEWDTKILFQSLKTTVKQVQQLKEGLKFENPSVIEYNAVLRANNLLDYNDLLLTGTQVAKTVDQDLQFIFADEFQDTNSLQWNFLRHLVTRNNADLSVVGDPNQEIYEFLHSGQESPFDRMKRTLPVKIAHLDINFRSPESLVKFANTIIPAAYHLRSYKPGGRLPILKLAGPSAISAEEMTKDFVKVISGLHKNSYAYKDIAVLTYTNKELVHISNSLESAGIPYQTRFNKSLFEAPACRVLYSLLKYSYEPRDAYLLGLIDTTRSPFSKPTVQKLRERTENFRHPISEEMKKISSWYRGSKNKCARMEEYYRDIVDTSEQLRTESDLDAFEQRCHLYLERNRLIWESYKSGKTNIDDLFRHIRHLIQGHDIQIDQVKGLAPSIVESLSRISSASIPLERDAVQLRTVHSAKGMEWPAVLLPNMSSVLSSGLAPKLAFVAVTRAKEFLYMSSERPLEYPGSMSTDIVETHELSKSLLSQYRLEYPNVFRSYPIAKMRLPRVF